MFFYTYVLKSKKDDSFYVGYTENLSKRLKEHNNSENISTKKGIPWELIYFEGCLNRQDALRRERYFKTSQGSRLLKARLKEYLYSRRS